MVDTQLDSKAEGVKFDGDSCLPNPTDTFRVTEGWSWEELETNVAETNAGSRHFFPATCHVIVSETRDRILVFYSAD